MFARLTALVSSGSSVPFELGEAYDTAWGQWAHHRGTWKADGSDVSVFRISAHSKDDAKLTAARNGIKRLRGVSARAGGADARTRRTNRPRPTLAHPHLPLQLRHPNILCFKDTAEMEDKGEAALYLVTEPVTPLLDVLDTINVRGPERCGAEQTATNAPQGAGRGGQRTSRAAARAPAWLCSPRLAALSLRVLAAAAPPQGPVHCVWAEPGRQRGGLPEQRLQAGAPSFFHCCSRRRCCRRQRLPTPTAAGCCVPLAAASCWRSTFRPPRTQLHPPAHPHATPPAVREARAPLPPPAHRSTATSACRLWW
jgi:hypothetical protein